MSTGSPPTPQDEDEVKRLRLKYGVDKPADSGPNYSSAGAELAFIVILCGAIGYGLDRWIGSSPWFLLAGLLFGIVGALYRLILKFGGFS